MKSDFLEIRAESADTDCPGRIRDSGGQLGAALGTTCVHDGATGASPHTQTEAVHASATTVVRLEGALPLGHWKLLVLELQAVFGPSWIGRGRARDERALPQSMYRRPFEGTGPRKPNQTTGYLQISPDPNYTCGICSQNNPQVWTTLWTTRAETRVRGTL